MYKIKCDGLVIYDDTSKTIDPGESGHTKLVNPVLEMEDSKAGSLKMSVPVGNVGYSRISRMTSDITVLKNDEEFWWGRVLSEDKDFWNNKIFTCEGALAFLNDICQPLNDTYGQFISIGNYVSNLLDVYNNSASPSRKIYLGTFEDSSTIIATANYVTNYESTMEWISKIAEEFNYHLRIRKQNGYFYLDFLKNYLSTINQRIEFGSNLLDFTKKMTGEGFATVVIPLGYKDGLTDNNDVDTRLTVETYETTQYHQNGSIYVFDPNVVSSYGRIEKVVTFDDEEDVGQLYGRGLNYLQNSQFDKVELEITAVDLSYLNANIDSVSLLHQVRAISSPHGMDHTFPITKITIPFDEPENAKFTLGDSVSSSLTGTNGRMDQIIKDQLKNLPNTKSVLEAAQERASEVMNRFTVGYVTLHQAQDAGGNPYTDAIYISDTPDLETATKVWKWDMNGLGYADSKDIHGDWVWGTAMTMNGEIVADYVSTGNLNADLLTAGTIKGRNVYLYQTLYDEFGDIIAGHEGARLEFWGAKGKDGDDQYIMNSYGSLFLDDNGSGDNISEHRIYLMTGPQVALKFFSGAGLSLEASGGPFYAKSSGGHAQIEAVGNHEETLDGVVSDHPNNVILSSEQGDILLTTSAGHTAYLNGSEILTRSDVPDVIAKFG